MRYTHVENALSLRNVESRVMILTAISWLASSASWTVPRNLSAKQKELLQEFERQVGEESHYEKRKGFFDRLKDFMAGND